MYGIYRRHITGRLNFSAIIYYIFNIVIRRIKNLHDMSPASNAAKEKYAAVLEDAKIYQHAGCKRIRSVSRRCPV